MNMCVCVLFCVVGVGVDSERGERGEREGEVPKGIEGRLRVRRESKRASQ